jgi:hypothetical protein
MFCTDKLTQTSPLAQLLSIGYLDQGDLVLRAKCNHQLLVRLLLTGLVQDAHVCLATVEGLGGLAQTSSKTVVHERKLEDTLEGVENGHLALGRGISRNFNLIGLGDLGDGGGGFFVRLEGSLSVWLTIYRSCACALAQEPICRELGGSIPLLVIS